jgi:hypothetical protein
VRAEALSSITAVARQSEGETNADEGLCGSAPQESTRA